MPQIKDSFILNSNVPNFTRDSFDTWEDMILVDPDNIDKGHISYCKETKKHYIFHNEDDVLWKDLSYQDVLTVTKDEMLDLKDDVPVGKLIYCTTDGLMYYKYRNVIEDNTDIYKKLVNIEDATYVTEEEFPNMVDERIRDFDFGTSGLVTYETIEDMKKVVPGDDSVPGQPEKRHSGRTPQRNHADGLQERSEGGGQPVRFGDCFPDREHAGNRRAAHLSPWPSRGENHHPARS